MSKKITELEEATNIENEDLLTIVQNNKNKKVKSTIIIQKIALIMNPVRFNFA